MYPMPDGVPRHALISGRPLPVGAIAHGEYLTIGCLFPSHKIKSRIARHVAIGMKGNLAENLSNCPTVDQAVSQLFDRGNHLLAVKYGVGTIGRPDALERDIGRAVIKRRSVQQEVFRWL